MNDTARGFLGDCPFRESVAISLSFFVCVCVTRLRAGLSAGSPGAIMQAAAMMKLSMRHKHAQVWPGEDETAADPSREPTLSHDDSFRSPRSPSPTNFKNLKFKAASPLAKDGRKHESKLERSTENDALTR